MGFLTACGIKCRKTRSKGTVKAWKKALDQIQIKTVVGTRPELKITYFYPFLPQQKPTLQSEYSVLFSATYPVYLRPLESQGASSEKHCVAMEAHSCVAMRSLIYIPTPQRAHIPQTQTGRHTAIAKTLLQHPNDTQTRQRIPARRIRAHGLGLGHTVVETGKQSERFKS